MFGTLKGRLLIIALVVIGAVAVLVTRPVKYGLDIAGGMYIALEVSDPDGTMDPDLKRQHTEQNVHILRNRLDEFGVAEPNVSTTGDYRIIVELPGLEDEERADSIIRRQAFLEWKEVRDLDDLRTALPRMDRAVLAALGPDADIELEEIAADTSNQLQQGVRDQLFGRQRDSVSADSTAATDSLAADTTGADSAGASVTNRPTATPLSSLLQDSGVQGELIVAEQDVPRVKRYLELPGVLDHLPRGGQLLWDSKTLARGATSYRSLYYLDARPFITGESLESATPGRDPQFGATIVSFNLDRRGGRLFDEVTARNIGERIAIVLDNQVHSAPNVNSRIGASGQIEMGQAPFEEAAELSIVLNAGAFSAPVDIMEKHRISPSLGQDSIDQGKIAGVLGVIAVILIMILYYRMAGIIAVVALSIYALLVLAGLAAFGAALTAPGIAGMILSLGMAVDANVLIFERIREELTLGRTVRAAVDNGFQHAMSAIVDSNLTTLITALILYQIGTGPVRGFAVTLSIGIVASFFTAVFITRTFFMLYLDRRRTADAISI
ncbi:MAG TPA: protein translocase subunit SecD [Longimicrobiales bacterium]|nr:protein translocase subunit SecD [Longimicrobiales bacterium]